VWTLLVVEVFEKAGPEGVIGSGRFVDTDEDDVERALRKTQFLVLLVEFKNNTRGHHPSPSVQHSYAMLISKLLLHPYDNHFLASSADNFRFCTQDPGCFLDLLAYSQRIRHSVWTVWPLYFAASPHTPSKRCLGVV
jgi:hypothetical protein